MSKYLLLPVCFFISQVCFVSYGQENPLENNLHFELKGVVLNANTELPISAAQIKALNNEISATTDEEGNFIMHLNSINEVLQITAFDYNQREIAVRGRNELTIYLYPEMFTKSFDFINNSTGTKRSSWTIGTTHALNEFGKTTISVDEEIQSRMGGAVRSISHSGTIGLGTSMFIRGYNSLNRNAQPLYVVDGVVWDNAKSRFSINEGYYHNALADIDINDIESVTVIKDGLSIYGDNGSNGVVLIKTRRGEGMPTKIVVNASGGVTMQPISLPLLDVDEYRIYASEVLSTVYSPEYIDGIAFLQDDPSELTYNQYHNNTDWDDEIYQLGSTQKYNIYVNGGDEKALYDFSMGYTGTKGVVKSTDLQRLNMRFNGDFKMTSFLNMDLNVGFTNIDRTLLDDGVNYYTSPTYLAMIKAPFLSPYSYTLAGTLTTDVEDSDILGVGNPSAIIQNALNTDKHYRLSIAAKPTIIFSPSLSLSSLFSYSLDKTKQTNYSPMVGVADRYIPGFGISENLFKSFQHRDVHVYDDTRLQYATKMFKHELQARLGTRYSANFIESDYGEGHNSGSDQNRNLGNDREFKDIFGNNSSIKSIANYLSVDYDLDNRYFLEASFTMNTASNFGRETEGGIQMLDRSWAMFPSVNAAWLISSERFLSTAQFIDYLKLRMGYGLTGNSDIDPYSWTGYYSSQKYIDRANGLLIDNLANNAIQWELSTKANVGVDAKIFNDRLSLSGDVYASKTTELLTLKNLPEIAGEGYYWDNDGEMSNTGFEVNSNIKILNKTKLKLELGASIGHYKNEILALADGDYSTSIFGGEVLTSVGNPAGMFYGYKTKGVFSTWQDAADANLKMISASGDEIYFEAGDVHFDDLNNDGIINENDKQIIGDPNPDFFGNISGRIGLGKVTFEALFTYSYGNEIYNYLRHNLESGNGTNNQTTSMLSRWTYEGQETELPRAVMGDPMGNSRFSDRWIEDGSYLRLKSISVSYDIPYKNALIEGLNIWASATNLWTLTQYLGRDPEVSAGNQVLYQGIDTGLLPTTRSFFVGLKVNL